MADKPFYRAWFINQFGHLRAAWRIALFLILTFMLGAIIVFVAEFIPFPDEGDALLTWNELASRSGMCLAMIFAAYITLRWVDRRPFVLLGLNLLQGWKRDFGIGLIIGIVMISVTVMVKFIAAAVNPAASAITRQFPAGTAANSKPPLGPATVLWEPPSQSSTTVILI